MKIVADGPQRFLQATAEARRRREAEIRSEVQSKYEARLSSAGPLARCLLRLKIECEISANIENEYPIHANLHFTGKKERGA